MGESREPRQSDSIESLVAGMNRIGRFTPAGTFRLMESMWNVPNSFAWLMIAAGLGPLEERAQENLPDASDPVVAQLVASVGEAFGLENPLSVRIETGERLQQFKRDPGSSRSVEMTRILHVLGVSTAPPIEAMDTGSNPTPEEPPFASDAGLGVVAVFDPSSTVDSPVLWIRSGPIDLGDLIVVGREAARACQEILTRNPPPGISVPLFSIDHPDDDRSLALQIIRSAQVEHVVHQVLRDQSEEIARRGFLPPASLSSWKTPSETAWDLAIDRFELDVGRSYLERIVASSGEGVVMPWAVPPTSTSDLKRDRRRPSAVFEPNWRFPIRPSGAGAGDVAAGDAAADGGDAVVDWSMGELRIELILRLAADPLRAIVASSGWLGDRIAWYDRPSGDGVPGTQEEPVDERNRSTTDVGSGLVLWDLRFESEEDAREMVDAFRKLFERRYAEQSDPGLKIDRDRADLSWARASASNRDWAVTRRRGPSVRLSISPDGPLPSWANNWVEERF